MTNTVRINPDKHVADFSWYCVPVVSPFRRKSIVVPYFPIRSPSLNNFLWVADVGTEDYVISLDICAGHFSPPHDIFVAIIGVPDAPTEEKIRYTLSSRVDQKFLRMFNPELKLSEKQELLELLRHFQPNFDPTIISSSSGQYTSIKCTSPRVLSVERKTIHNHVSDILTKAIVKVSSSPWSSPVVLIR